MKIIDVAEPSKIDCNPDKIITLIQNGNLVQDEFKIQTVELRSYKPVSYTHLTLPTKA